MVGCVMVGVVEMSAMNMKNPLLLVVFLVALSDGGALQNLDASRVLTCGAEAYQQRAMGSG